VPLIYIGMASCGRAAGANGVLAAVQETLEQERLQARIIQTGCIGPCYLEPLLDIALPGQPRVSFANVTPEQAKRIVSKSLKGGEVPLQQAVGHFGDGDAQLSVDLPRFFDLPMLKPQVRVVLKNCGLIDPEDVFHYLANDGYAGLMRAFAIGAEAVVKEVREAGLRGRGGAGFPTHRKWEICREARSEVKYLICNADEGDPGAFMNRSLLESDPHAVLEGMLIAAFAIGATQGYIYIRAEYPLAVQRLRQAIAQMRSCGFLGKNIQGSGFSFDITIKEGAGAFVCGEETALIASIEGKRGMPRSRPPFPAVSGLHGKPTIINNVETLARCRTSYATVRPGIGSLALRGTMAPRRSPWCARCGAPVSSKSPWAHPCAASSSTSAGARASRSKPCRRVGLPAAACRRSSWIPQWITNRWPLPAPSWARAG